MTADYVAEECRANDAYVNDTTNLTRFHSSGIPSITLRDYFRRIAKYAHCSAECFIVALIYLNRYCTAQRVPLTLRNAHRVSIVAVMVAAKLRDDIFYSNTYYANIGGIHADEVNHLELEFLSVLRWRTWVDRAEYDQVYAAVVETAARVDAAMAAQAGGVAAPTAGQPAVVMAHQHQQPQHYYPQQPPHTDHHQQQYYGQQQQRAPATTATASLVPNAGSHAATSC
jgi:hypothetical protein